MPKCRGFGPPMPNLQLIYTGALYTMIFGFASSLAVRPSTHLQELLHVLGLFHEPSVWTPTLKTVYILIYVYICTWISIFIYRHREREREREIHHLRIKVTTSQPTQRRKNTGKAQIGARTSNLCHYVVPLWVSCAFFGSENWYRTPKGPIRPKYRNPDPWQPTKSRT